jgi:hypothetical protein
LGLRQPNGLTVKADLKVQAAIVVDQQLALGCQFIAHDCQQKRLRVLAEAAARIARKT